MTKKDNEVFKNSPKVWFWELYYVGSVKLIMLMAMLNEDIIVISYENIEALHIEVAISTLNQVVKFLLYSTTLKKLRFSSYYTKTREIQY